MKQLTKRFPADFIISTIKDFTQRKISEKEACGWLSLKRARLYRLASKLRRSNFSPQALVHGNIGQIRYRYSPQETLFLTEELKYIAQKSENFQGDFNFEYLAEKFARTFDRKTYRASIRAFAIRENYYQPEKKKQVETFRRFDTGQVGQLFQHDSSNHLWLPALNHRLDLIATEDDHSRLITGWDLVEREDVWAHLMVIKKTALTVGLPLAYYVDHDSIFRVNPKQRFWFTPVGWLSSETGLTQVQRALRSLSTALLFAPLLRPEAKGKIEKRFDYLQERIPRECERLAIKTIPEAKKIVAQIVDYYNTSRIHEETKEVPLKRWKKAIREGRTKLRRIPTDKNLKDIFCLEDERVVRKDGTIQFLGKFWKVAAKPYETVTLHFIPHEELRILKDKIIINVFKL